MLNAVDSNQNIIAHVIKTLCPSCYALSIIFAASSIENALSVSLRTLPRLSVLSKMDAIVSSFGTSIVVTISYLPSV